MPKAYWIGIVDVKNQEEYKKYADIAGPALIKAGAKILSRGGRIKNLEGKKINRAVIIEFPSMVEATQKSLQLFTEQVDELQKEMDEKIEKLAIYD